MNEQVKNLMELLGCDEQTAKEIIADDERIDKGEKLFEQTAEQKANSKKYVSTGTRKPMTPNLPKKERKADVEKRGLVELFAEVLKEQPACNTLTVTNIERQIDFEWAGRKMRIVLSAPRN